MSREIPIDLYPHELKALRDGRLGLIVRPVDAAWNDYERVMWDSKRETFDFHHPEGTGAIVTCPLGQPGDRLLIVLSYGKFLETTDVAVKRVQEITQTEAAGAGWACEGLDIGDAGAYAAYGEPALDWLSEVWDSFFTETPWDDNPWAWLAWVKQTA